MPRSFLDEKKETFGESFLTEVPIENAFLKLIHENFISTPTVMVRKQCFETTGLFDESLWSVEDRDLWLRITANFNLACLPRVLCKRRIHESNISGQSELTVRSRIKVLEKNWRNFPFLVPTEIWHGKLAEHYCQIGYVLLQRGLRRKALKAGFTSLAHAFREMINKKGPPSYSWGLGISLIPAALLGWQFSRLLFRPMRKQLVTGKRSGASMNVKSE
jgi:hypothetical protein